MDTLTTLIKRELAQMLDLEIDYVTNLWNDVYKLKDSLTKDDILDLANCYIQLLSKKIKNLEEEEA